MDSTQLSTREETCKRSWRTLANVGGIATSIVLTTTITDEMVAQKVTFLVCLFVHLFSCLYFQSSFCSFVRLFVRLQLVSIAHLSAHFR